MAQETNNTAAHQGARALGAWAKTLKSHPKGVFDPEAETTANPIAVTADLNSDRSYRCSYHPKDLNGHPMAADSGVLPYIQLKASNAENAQRAAFAVTGCVVSGVERMEAGAV